MSTKYNTRSIRNEIVEHLKAFYPSSLEKFDELKTKTSRILFALSSNDQDFQLLALARKCEANNVLPALFFACSQKPLQEILVSHNIISQEDLGAIIVGRDTLLKGAYQAATLAWSQPYRETICCNERCLAERRVLASGEW